MYNSYQNKQRAVRVGDWKLIRYWVNEVEHTQLFNLKDDPWETIDRSNESGQQARVKALKAKLRERMIANDDPADVDALTRD